MNLGVVGGNYYGGTLDDLRIYNRTLSASDVTRLYGLGGTSYINTAVPSNTSLSTAGSGTNGMVLDYSFDGNKVSGTTITDESGNGKNAALSRGLVNYLVVAGGGSGAGATSGYYAAGGGAGGLATGTVAVTTQAYTILVGAGGTAVGQEDQGNNGQVSLFSSTSPVRAARSVKSCLQS